MRRRFVVSALAIAGLAAWPVAGAESQTREFRASAGGKLVLDLETGAEVQIEGTGGSSVSVNYTLSCKPECELLFDESGGGLKISSRFKSHASHQNSDVDLKIKVPRSYDLEIDSMGGALSIDGVDGKFTGETKGGELKLHDVHGEATLKTMGGEIHVTDATLDGSVKTMGGEVVFENVTGDVKGSSMGGNVRYKNVRRRDGGVASPPQLGGGVEKATGDSVQISTMGGEIEIQDAPAGADLQTMGGNISVKDAREFVRAKTMGGDIVLAAVDGWVQATTMGGDIDATLTGSGGDVTLTSMSGDVTLHVPPGFGMDLDLQIAYTRNSNQKFHIDAPGGATPTVSPDWDYDKGTARKYIRVSGPVGGGGHKVKIETVNGNIVVK